MHVSAIAFIAATLFAWGLVSKRLARADLTAPIPSSSSLGAALAWGRAGRRARGASGDAHPARRGHPGLGALLGCCPPARCASPAPRRVAAYLRLLAVGLPLTVLLGWALAAWLWPGLGLWLALFVGAALAPTDAALGDPGGHQSRRSPSRIRQLITVESGLNDGIATPIVTVAIAGAAAAARPSRAHRGCRPRTSCSPGPGGRVSDLQSAPRVAGSCDWPRRRRPGPPRTSRWHCSPCAGAACLLRRARPGRQRVRRRVLRWPLAFGACARPQGAGGARLPRTDG